MQAFFYCQCQFAIYVYMLSGSDDDKLLGSILLPSYTISPLTKDEGGVSYRKYSFKAEHQNMRTFYFAAETKESMGQWVRALTLATIMQQETK